MLMTFDLVTDWINWKQWSEVGGYYGHHLMFIFKTTFLCVASVGTILWIIETITIVIKLFWIHAIDAENISYESLERHRNDTKEPETGFKETEKFQKS